MECTDYEKKELHLNDNYNFMEYEDKGLSGFYFDRSDFQRMLHDVQVVKIRAIVCYRPYWKKDYRPALSVDSLEKTILTC